MHKAIIDGKESASVIDVDVGTPPQGWVKIKIHAAPMCTEFKAFKAGNERAHLGHEAAGEIVASASDRRSVGDRVVAMPQFACGTCDHCRGGEYIHCRDQLPTDKIETGTFAQYLLKPDWLTVTVPDDVSHVHASMACCGLGPTLGAADALDVGPADTVLVNGLGPVGLGGIINATYRNARVIGVEPHAYRADLARELGATRVIDPTTEDVVEVLNAVTDGIGADKVFETSGVPAAQRTAVDAVRPRGSIAFVADAGEVTLEVGPDIVQGGATMVGTWHYPERLIPTMRTMIGDVGEQIDTLITHEYSLSAVQDAFERQLTGECGKVVLGPWA